ncbi:MAG TPA: IS6 family transposase [Pyrinomonadaceae bacterium]|jgi:transposase-like protein
MRRNSSPFKWRHYAPDVIPLCLRRYCHYSLGHRDIEEMTRERGLTADHVNAFRRVQRCAPEINKRMRPHLKMSGASHRPDETYVKVGGSWKYLRRAADKDGAAIESTPSAKRDVPAAKRFFKELMRAGRRRPPFAVGADRRASHPEAFATPVKGEVLPADCELRGVEYLNNVIEQGHRTMRRRWRAKQWFRPLHTAGRTPEGVESLHMIGKGRVKRLDGRDAAGRAKSVASSPV